MTAPDPTAGEREPYCTACLFTDRQCMESDGGCCDVCRATGGCSHTTDFPAVAASTGTSEDEETRCIVGLSDAERDDWAEVLIRRWGCEMDDESAYDNACRDVDALWHLVAAREAAARAEERERIAQAQRCGGCKGQGSHRRHCPRHPNYHPWIPLADRAESIGDSIGEPGLANQAWALAAAIRDEMPNHPYRPARHREAR